MFLLQNFVKKNKIAICIYRTLGELNFHIRMHTNTCSIIKVVY